MLLMLFSMMAMAVMFSGDTFARAESEKDDTAPVCENSSRDPPKILINGSFQELETLTSFQDTEIQL